MQSGAGEKGDRKVVSFELCHFHLYSCYTFFFSYSSPTFFTLPRQSFSGCTFFMVYWKFFLLRYILCTSKHIGNRQADEWIFWGVQNGEGGLCGARWIVKVHPMGMSLLRLHFMFQNLTHFVSSSIQKGGFCVGEFGKHKSKISTLTDSFASWHCIFTICVLLYSFPSSLWMVMVVVASANGKLCGELLAKTNNFTVQTFPLCTVVGTRSWSVSIYLQNATGC